MTNEEREIFCRAACAGIACGLEHRYEWYVNYDRALMQILPWDKVPEEAKKLLDAFIAFEKTTAGCPEEDEELQRMGYEEFAVRVNNYKRAREKYEREKRMGVEGK